VLLPDDLVFDGDVLRPNGAAAPPCDARLHGREHVESRLEMASGHGLLGMGDVKLGNVGRREHVLRPDHAVDDGDVLGPDAG